MTQSAHSSPFTDKKLDLTVAVVICTRNRPAELRNCLQGIALLKPAPTEVIVIDNTQGDKETESLAHEFSARYMIEPMSGLSRARNRAISESKSDIVAYLDDDAVPDERWLEFLIEPFVNPHVAVVTGETTLPESLPRISRPEPVRFLDNKHHQWFEIAAYGGLGIGTNMALRKGACIGLNIFDERLGRGAPLNAMEEFYAFVRLLSLNYCAVHVPAAIVIHPFVRRSSLEQEASRSVAYWLLLFFDFPGHRRDLLSFLFRRLRHKPPTWTRNSPNPGHIITSGWRVRINAVLAGILLYMSTTKPKEK